MSFLAHYDMKTNIKDPLKCVKVQSTFYMSMTPQQAIVPDQGWSWVVLAAAFACNVICDGIIFTFGVLYTELLDVFGEGRTVTAWVGSALSGVYGVGGWLVFGLAFIRFSHTCTDSELHVDIPISKLILIYIHCWLQESLPAS